MSALRIQLFGSVSASLEGKSLLDGCGIRERGILTILTLRDGREVDRNVLADTLWPDAEPELARYNLRRYLSRLRTALGDEASRIQTVKPRAIRFDRSNAWVDVLEFDNLVSSSSLDKLAAAISLYSAPLAECCVEEWFHAERLRREVAYVDALVTLSNQAVELEHWEEAIGRSRMLIAADPLRESAHRTLMLALYKTGSMAAAHQVYRDLRLRLREAINREPDPETQALFAKLRSTPREVIEPARDAKVSHESPRIPARRDNIPDPQNPLIGREMDVSELEHLILSTRLLTLTGAGGVGKTRLATEIGRRVRERFDGGAFFVDLSSITNPDVVPLTVLQILGGEGSHGDPVTTICGLLDSRHVLIILDNCEQVASACAHLCDAIGNYCPNVRTLATSRHVLGVEGETVRQIPPLETPPHLTQPGALLKDTSDALDYDAVQLFIARAKQALPGFRLLHRDLPTIGRVCRSVDGIPLAIELAANRLKALSIDQIAERLSDRFRLLSEGRSTAPKRHQTMSALLDWSYDLLDEDERWLLRTVSVFRGGWSLDAVLALGRGMRDDWDIINLLASLVDKSLIQNQMASSGVVRYSLLESIREYAHGKLTAQGELSEVQQSHIDWCIRFGEEALEKLTGHEAVQWIENLEHDHDNFRAALDVAISSAEEGDWSALKQAYRLAYALWRFWYMRSYFWEGIQLLERLLAIPTAPDLKLLRAKNLHVLAHFQIRHAHLERATENLRECKNLFHELGDFSSEARTRSTLSDIQRQHGQYEEALENDLFAFETMTRDGNALIAYSALTGAAYSLLLLGRLDEAEERFRQCIHAFEKMGNALGTATSCILLAEVNINRGDFKPAVSFAKRALEIRQDVGDREGIAYALTCLGRIACFQGNFTLSSQHHLESLAIRRELQSPSHVAEAECDLAQLALASNRRAEARVHLLEALRLGQEIGDLGGLSYVVRTARDFCMVELDYETAARLTGFLKSYGHMDITPIPPALRKVHLQTLADLAQFMIADHLDTLRIEGANWNHRDAVSWAYNRLTTG